MARFGSCKSEAFSWRKDQFSPDLSNLLRTDRKVSRSDVLLGTSTLSLQPCSPPVSEFSMKSLAHATLLVDDKDLVEFREEDIWAADTGGSWSEVKDPQGIEGLGPNEKEAKEREEKLRSQTRDGFPSRENSNIDDLTTIRMITNNNRRRLCLDRELGLTAAFTDRGPGLSSTSLSRVGWTQALSTRYSSPGVRNAASGSQTIPGATSPYPYSGPVAFKVTKQLQHHQSAPLNVPDWSKILGATTHSDAVGINEDEEERLPPHELLARESARSPMYSSSMCEGVGRTLKGRDLSRVRNAVMRQTGFID